jgi:hypothetical protein
MDLTAPRSHLVGQKGGGRQHVQRAHHVAQVLHVSGKLVAPLRMGGERGVAGPSLLVTSLEHTSWHDASGSRHNGSGKHIPCGTVRARAVPDPMSGYQHRRSWLSGVTQLVVTSQELVLRNPFVWYATTRSGVWLAGPSRAKLWTRTNAPKISLAEFGA